MRRGMGIVLLASFFCITTFASAQAPKRDKSERERMLAQFEEQFREVGETARPCIATIIVSRSEHYPKNPNAGENPGKLGDFDLQDFLKNNKSQEKKKLGDYLDLSRVEMVPNHGYLGGVVIDSSGLVLTPFHALEGATKIYVFLPGSSGGRPAGSYADVYAADTRSDLAVLKLINPPANLKSITFADVRLTNRGDQKATMYEGKMVGLLYNSYSTAIAFDGKPNVYFGSITRIGERFNNLAKQRKGPQESYYKFGHLLKHDIARIDIHRKPSEVDFLAEPVNAGMSGGVLVDMHGRMVGLTSSPIVYDKEIGPGYAIPIEDTVKKVIEVLSRGEEVEYGFLGITLDELFNNSVHISTVTRSSPAEMAGLEHGDTITKINDFPVYVYEDLLLYAGSSLAGTRVKLNVLRKDAVLPDVYLTLGKYHHTLPVIASVRPEPVFGIRVDYLNFQKEQTEITTGHGVTIREVLPNSPAENKFKALGDNPSKWIITHVNGAAISNPIEFYKAAKGQSSVKLSLRDSNAPNRQEITLP